MPHSFQALVTDPVAQLGMIVIGLPVSSASPGLQILALAMLLGLAAATTARVRAAWRALPPGPADRRCP